MKFAAAAVLGLAVLAAPAFAEPGPAEGAALYEAKCKMCHEPGMMNAPKMDKLATFDNDKIIQALDKISVFTSVHVDGNKPPSFLVAVLQKVRKTIIDSKSALLEFVIDEPIIETQAQPPETPSEHTSNA